MTRTKEIIILLIVAVTVAAIWWFGQKPKPEPESPPEYEKVSFCGKEYWTEKIEIEGVDVVKRIADLVTGGKETEYICTDIETGIYPKSNILQTSKVLLTDLTDLPQEYTIYIVKINGRQFDVVIEKNEIYHGDPVGYEYNLLGSLRP